MAATQYFWTKTWTETSTGPNKCLNQDQDCVCFNGQDRYTMIDLKINNISDKKNLYLFTGGHSGW